VSDAIKSRIEWRRKLPIKAAGCYDCDAWFAIEAGGTCPSLENHRVETGHSVWIECVAPADLTQTVNEGRQKLGLPPLPGCEGERFGDS
jgi:hypothetical protein